MVILKAISLKIGQSVTCPPDRGDKGYRGEVTFVGTEVYKSFTGVEFIWVSVKGLSKTSVWPSNRLMANF